MLRSFSVARHSCRLKMRGGHFSKQTPEIHREARQERKDALEPLAFLALLAVKNSKCAVENIRFGIAEIGVKS